MEPLSEVSVESLDLDDARLGSARSAKLSYKTRVNRIKMVLVVLFYGINSTVMRKIPNMELVYTTKKGAIYAVAIALRFNPRRMCTYLGEHHIFLF